jgi:hypothetical protein
MSQKLEDDRRTRENLARHRLESGYGRRRKNENEQWEQQIESVLTRKNRCAKEENRAALDKTRKQRTEGTSDLAGSKSKW